MSEVGVPDIEPYLCAFLPFFLAEKGGLQKDGRISYIYTDEELQQLYPRYSADNLFESIRRWVCEGYWDRELFMKEVSRISADMVE